MKKNLIFSALAILFLWLVWIVACAWIGNEYLLPSFSDTCSALGRLLTEVAFWRAFFGTLLRTLWAFLLSLVLGAGLAVVAGVFPSFRSFLAPIISLLRTVPTMAIILLLLFWTTPRVAPVLVSLLVLFPAFYAATLASLDEVTENYFPLVRAFGVGRKRTVFYLYFPLTAPSVLKQAGPIFSLGLKITVSGEVLANTYHSLGGLMQEAKIFVSMPTLMALTLVSVLIGFALEGLCLLAYRLIVRWRT